MGTTLISAKSSPEDGDVWTVKKKLGQGTFGSVFLVQNTKHQGSEVS
jgi:hypothetical protein